ncbi:unnamed protein product [Diatraea saccharalis]|uniref:Arrestin C-terminal-like domain-containing protein n=1 Tax=Diatraea saccharalis TaxID=40085 RepID=A0A9N9QYD7_9NEOP|nr:unnamed protein product [Diatraea saccharalis]
MAITCKINLTNELDHVFVPGETVYGVVQYKLSEDITFKKISISLKGKDLLSIDGTYQTVDCSDASNKNYVEVTNIVHEDERGSTFASGEYEMSFSMTLPYNIPKSFNYKKNKDGYYINYKLFYYVRVKFERPGILNKSQSFKKWINVTSSIVPTLPRVSVTYEEKKRLIKLFSRRENAITLKATVDNSIVEPGGRVKLQCDVKNDSAFNIKEIEIKLVEDFRIKSANINENVCDVLHTIRLNPSLSIRGDTDLMKVVLDVPRDAHTVNNSRLVDRNYFVYITAVLPAFYRNAVLKVPIEVGENNLDNIVVRDAPPSYWDAMNLNRPEVTK